MYFFSSEKHFPVIGKIAPLLLKVKCSVIQHALLESDGSWERIKPSWYLLLLHYKHKHYESWLSGATCLLVDLSFSELAYGVGLVQSAPRHQFWRFRYKYTCNLGTWKSSRANIKQFVIWVHVWHHSYSYSFHFVTEAVIKSNPLPSTYI